MKNIKIVYCQGAEWRDKANGNTYCNTKVIDGEDIDYLGYEYGYGNYYRYRAIEYFDCKYGPGKYKMIDLGCNYVLKSVLKNNRF